MRLGSTVIALQAFDWAWSPRKRGWRLSRGKTAAWSSSNRPHPHGDRRFLRWHFGYASRAPGWCIFG